MNQSVAFLCSAQTYTSSALSVPSGVKTPKNIFSFRSALAAFHIAKVGLGAKVRLHLAHILIRILARRMGWLQRSQFIVWIPK